MPPKTKARLKWVCMTCGREFTMKAHLARHMSSHSHEDHEQGDPVEVVMSYAQKFQSIKDEIELLSSQRSSLLQEIKFLETQKAEYFQELDLVDEKLDKMKTTRTELIGALTPLLELTSTLEELEHIGEG